MNSSTPDPGQINSQRQVDFPAEEFVARMWIPEEKLYIRVEDTVVVTKDGIENLTSGAPLELDDVEALMRDEGTRLPYLPIDGG